MDRTRSSLRDLLHAIARDRDDLTLAAFPDRDIRWAVASGLAPLLKRAVRRDPAAAESPHWPLLQGADLTARVLAAAQVDAVTEIIDACRSRVLITLLKGISLSDQYYPEPHLRPMRDIDILVPEASVPEVVEVIRRLGYRDRPDPRVRAYEHHAVPLVHAETGIWVEVHHRLFPPGARRDGVDPFPPERVAGKLRASTFHGRPVGRLSDALQIPYLASHWALSPSGIYDGGGAIGIVDLAYVLAGSHELCWDDVLAEVHGSVAGGHLYLVLGYLRRSSLADLPRHVLEDLGGTQRSLNGASEAILHRILDRYVVEGREYGWLVRPGTIEITWRALLMPGPPVFNLTRWPYHLIGRAVSRMLQA